MNRIRAKNTSQFTLSIVLSFLLIAIPASATVIRHDRTDADMLKLGERFEAVCRVIPDGSCTLIAESWVITAAHVARSIREGSEIRIGDASYKVKRVIVHPDGTGPPGRPPEVDLALVELAEKVKGVSPIPVYNGDSELGKTLYIVGYGDFGNAHSALTRMDGKRRAVTNKVDDAGPRRIFMKFDEPPSGTEYEGVGGPGDSGGPALIEKDGKIYVAGVSSGSMNGKPGKYGVVDVYTRVGSYIKWIEESMNASATDSATDSESHSSVRMLFNRETIIAAVPGWSSRFKGFADSLIKDH